MVTAHPLVRFPIFLMGMLAGLQVLRAHGKWEDFEDPNVSKSLMYTLQPWRTAKTRCYEKEEEKIRTTKICKEDSIKIWWYRICYKIFLHNSLHYFQPHRILTYQNDFHHIDI